MTTLSNSQWEQYNQDGYLKLGKLFDAQGLKELQDRIDQIMLGTADVNYEQLLMQLDSETGNYEDAGVQSPGHKGSTLNYRKIQNLEFDPVFLAAMQLPIFEDICKRVYGEGTPISSFRAMFMNKPANRGTFLPFHQDRWTNLDRDPLVTIWIAMDPATIENGCVQVVPGTHHKLLNPEHPSGFLTEEMTAQYCPEDKRVFLELEPGEVVLLHNWLLHGSDRNNSSQSRRAFSICYMEAATNNFAYPIIFGENAMTPQSLVDRV